MYKDNYDLLVSAENDSAYHHFMAGLDESLGLDNSGIDAFKKSLSFDPEFALANALLAKQLAIYESPKKAQKYLNFALRYKQNSSPREQEIIIIISMLLSANPRCLDAALEHIKVYPNDIIILSIILGPFGLLAFSETLDWQQRNLTILKEVEGYFPDDNWWFKTTQAFMYIEGGKIQEAEPLSQSAWEMKNTGNCAHTLTHLHYETENYKEGRQFIKNWKLSNQGKSNMTHHVLWHDALLALKRNEKNEIYSMCKNLVANKSGAGNLEYFADNASLLWYCVIEGIKVPSLWFVQMYEYADTNFPDIGFKFVDLHRSMMAATLSKEEREEYLARISKHDNNDTSSLINLTQGFMACYDNKPLETTGFLSKIDKENAIYGGSSVQRYIIKETLLKKHKIVQKN